MSKHVLGDFDMPSEGDIIDRIAKEQEQIDDEKEAIKHKTDILRLFGDFGVTLTKKGKNYTGLCPWHDDKSPSLSVDREKGIYNCFGCSESGDVFKLVQKVKGLSFKKALEYLRDYTGTVKAPVTIKAVKKVAPEKKTVTVTLARITEHYHKKLYSTTEAVNYLETRGIKNKELYTRFQLGYSDGSLLKLISNGQREALKGLGILRETGSEHFFKCLIFPIFDDTGKTIGLYGRSLDPATKIPHLYLKGKHKGTFNRKASKVYEEIILTECIIDALSLIQLGFQNVQSIYGTNGFTDEHLQVLKDDRVKTVILALDNDEAGRKATEALTEKLTSEGLQVKQIYPTGKDWNEDLVSGIEKMTVEKRIEEAEVLKGEEDSTGFTAKKEGLRYTFRIGENTYRVLGVKELFVSNLRVNIKAEHNGENFYDNLDLYSARSRSSFSLNLSHLFGIEHKRIEKDLVSILEHLEEERDKRIEETTGIPLKIVVTEEERKLGMDFLTSFDMFEQIVNDSGVLGYVGEDLNKQLMYIAASSRKLDDPVSILIISRSSAGKSYLVETIRKMIPEEDVVSVTSLSDQALNYIPDGGLVHKFLILGEAVHSEIIEHQIREMLSGKQLSRMVTVKDTKTGKMESHNLKTKVIVAAVMSTTNHDINPENASRCFLINSDETESQTEKIHKYQRDKYTIDRYCEKLHLVPQIVKKHKAAQRLLRNILIVNDFGTYLNFPAALIRTRRDHDRFIDLIACVCFLRQYQKKVKTKEEIQAGGKLEYIECDCEDYRIAYEIMVNGVLSSTFAELPKSLVNFYEDVREIFKEAAKEKRLKNSEVTLTQREVRKKITWIGSESIKKYLNTLVKYEYLFVSKSGGRGSRYSYQLVSDEAMERLDYSMIPTPDEIEKRISKSE